MLGLPMEMDFTTLREKQAVGISKFLDTKDGRGKILQRYPLSNCSIKTLLSRRRSCPYVV